MLRVTHQGGRGTAGLEETLSPREIERFERCVLPYLDAGYNLARHLLRDPHEAEDAVQEACVRAIRHFRGFRGVDGRAWLLSIVRNTCFTQLRRRRSGGEAVEFEEELHSVETDTPGPEADLTRALAAERVQEELARLSAEFREVLVLRELEGLSYKEIAQITGAPMGTVMSRLARGRRQLSAALAIGPEERV
jgi:RNA polymerase sigma-70 factor, ECF subfamily